MAEATPDFPQQGRNILTEARRAQEAEALALAQTAKAWVGVVDDLLAQERADQKGARANEFGSFVLYSRSTPDDSALGRSPNPEVRRKDAGISFRGNGPAVRDGKPRYGQWAVTASYRRGITQSEDPSDGSVHFSFSPQVPMDTSLPYSQRRESFGPADAVKPDEFIAAMQVVRGKDAAAAAKRADFKGTAATASAAKALLTP